MILIVMGVTGAGKTTVGRLLAGSWAGSSPTRTNFIRRSNVEKMRQGIALNDDDREPWLAAASRGDCQGGSATGKNVVLACSALKRSPTVKN